MIFGIEGMTLLAAALGFIGFVILYVLIFATIVWAKTYRGAKRVFSSTSERKPMEWVIRDID